MKLFGAFAACALFLSAAVPAQAQSYGYVATIGADNGTLGVDNGHFNQPYGLAVDTAHGHLFVSDSVNNRVQVFDLATQAYVATIGANDGTAGVDNGHLDLPAGVAVDVANSRLFVPDVANNRVQIFSTATFAYVGTLGADNGAAGTDNAHFHDPFSVAVDPTNGQILVADLGNLRIQVFNAAKLTYVTTLSQTGPHLIVTTAPVGLAVDVARNRILIVDLKDDCVEAITGGNFLAAGTIGVCEGVPSLVNGQFNQPFAVGVDAANSRVLVADTVNNRVQVFDAASFGFLGVIGSDLGATGTDNADLFQPDGVAVDPGTGNVFIADTLNNRVQIFQAGAAAAQIYAAVLPGARSVAVGTTATVFAAIVNGSGETLNGCGVALPADAPPALSMSYETANAQNQVTGQPGVPASIVSQGDQTYLLNFQASQPITVLALPLVFSCTGATPAAVEPGLDTIDLSFQTDPGADVIALSATPTANGIVTVPLDGDNAFAVATVNLGAAQSLTVSVDFGGSSAPITAGICETNPSTGACLATPSESFQHSFTAGETPTFSIFVGSTGPIPFDPAGNRVFVRYTDSAGLSHGSTSVAVTTQ
jgi:DNA-binding beta-propeller fold protein YncE